MVEIVYEAMPVREIHKLNKSPEANHFTILQFKWFQSQYTYYVHIYVSTNTNCEHTLTEKFN